MLALKRKIDDTFYINILNMFDSIGEIDKEITKDFTNAQKESLQYISYTSL